MARCRFDAAREEVFKRDRGVCSRCGFDTEALRAAIHAYRGIVQRCGWLFSGPAVERNRRVALTAHWPSVVDLVKAIGKRAAKWPASLWECNHIVALSEGGALADPENLETLCAVCHAAHTAQLAGRLAKARRVSKKHGRAADPLRKESYGKA